MNVVHQNKLFDMTKEVLIKNNVLIARFMGWEIKNNRALLHDDYGIVKGLEFENLNFHTDWNEFMNVCKCINSLGEDDGYWFSDMYAHLCNKINRAITRKYNIEYAYPFVLEFIEWYNEEKSKLKSKMYV